MIELNFLQPDALFNASTFQHYSGTGYFYQIYHVTDIKNPKSWYQTDQKNNILMWQRNHTVPSSVLRRTFSKKEKGGSEICILSELQVVRNLQDLESL